ncbi:MAG: 30S ribosome-binding factor RbfA [Neisseriaceae bacterium]
MKKNFSRAERLKEQILKEIAEIIYHSVKDPGMGFTTFTEVELTKDLQHATVYYTVLDQKDKSGTYQALERSKGFVRSELAKRLTLYHVPNLSFSYDSSIEQGEKIVRILGQLYPNEKG